MPCAERPSFTASWLRALLPAVLLSVLLAACGGGDSTQVTYSGPGLQPGVAPVPEVVLAEPTGTNTTEVLVDSGPPGFGSLGAANIPYVTVTVCAPGSSSQCATIDHVILDTGSYGLRVLRSKVDALSLPLVQLTASPVDGTAVECYPFVVGGLWGPLARADVLIAGEASGNVDPQTGTWGPGAIPIQLIDDLGLAGTGPTADCLQATGNQVLASASDLQANGVLGVGMVGIDCGKTCALGDYAGGHVQYYVCPDTASANCQPAAIPNALQTQNPVVHFESNNNGTLISMPALPVLGAGKARGRLVFGIGTQTNNQITPTASANTVWVDTDPANYLTTYLYITTTLGSQSYIQSYIDSGSNALFFDDTALSQQCQVNSGAAQGGWYCPAKAQDLQATLSDLTGHSTAVSFTVNSADALFSTSSSAFSNLSGAVGQGAQSFVWGMPFFYGRSVYTSIWGQALSTNGPWYAF